MKAIYLLIATLPSLIIALPRYDQTCFLTAHNAYCHPKAGWHWYRQQHDSIEDQLRHGVRGFMIAVHDYKSNVCACHGKCSGLFGFQRSMGCGIKALFGKNPGYQSIADILDTFAQWLHKPNNRNEIITIFFENYIDDPKLNELLRTSNVYPLIFAPTHKTNSQWPLLQHMHNHNKRVVIFNEKKNGATLTHQTPLFFNLWEHVAESNFGTTKHHKVCVQRTESKEHEDQHGHKRSLYLLNYFAYPSFSYQGRKNNQYTKLMNVINQCSTNPEFCGKQKPNFIALDFATVGDGIKVVKELNGE